MALFPKQARVLRRDEFLRLQREGRRKHTERFVWLWITEVTQRHDEKGGTGSPEKCNAEKCNAEEGNADKCNAEMGSASHCIADDRGTKSAQPSASAETALTTVSNPSGSVRVSASSGRGRALPSAMHATLHAGRRPDDASSVGFTRFGVTVSKKVGNAVARNRVKRCLREAFREDAVTRGMGGCLVAMAKATAKGCNTQSVREEMRAASRSLLRAGSRRPETREPRRGPA